MSVPLILALLLVYCFTFPIEDRPYETDEQIASYVK